MKTGDPHALWPSGVGWTIGGLNLMPAEISRDFGLRFITVDDDLSPIEVAAVDDDDIGQFLLRRDQNGPAPGTDVEVDAAISRDDALAAVLRQMGLNTTAFEWITTVARWPYAPPRSSRPANNRNRPVRRPA